MSEVRRHTENASPKACAQDVGFGFRCQRAQGHEGPCSWDPKRLYGEDPVPLTDDLVAGDKP